MANNEMPIKIRASRYDPSLGGVNCSNFVNGQCLSHMASGLRWQDYMNYAVACPPEWAFHTKLIVNGKTYECLDRGSKIKISDNIGWVDFLSKGSPFDGYYYGKIVDATLIQPASTQPPFVYYSQKDPRWASISLTCNNGHKGTFLSHGCGETSFAMLMSTFIDPKYTPSAVLDDFYGYSYCGGTLPSYSVNMLSKQGFTVKGPITDLSTARNYIKEGWLAWIHLEYYENGKKIGHEVIITEIDSDNSFIVADPFYGTGSIGNSRFPYGEKNITEFYILKPPVVSK